MSEHQPQWYAIRTMPRHEKSVARLLRGYGYDVCLPISHEMRRWADRWKHVELPLFPGYLFAKFNREVHIWILAVPGVSAIVGNRGRLAAVDEMEMAALITFVNANMPATSVPGLITTDRVRICKGPLAGVEGSLVRHKNHDCIAMSITIFCRSVIVEIDRDWVWPVWPVYRSDGMSRSYRS